MKKAGQSYEFSNPDGKGEAVKLGRGYDATRQFLKENPKVQNEILKLIREKLKEQ
ncbi:MAG TPA: hypothetical protein VJI33_02390 [Candidatus Paceibacterota bacterium]